LPIVLAQLDRNFEDMKEMCMQGIDFVSSVGTASSSSTQSLKCRPEAMQLAAITRRVEKEMEDFWCLLSSSVDAPVLRVLQKLHGTVMEVAKEVAARPVGAEALAVTNFQPPDFDKLLTALSSRHPALAREIGRTAAASLKFEYIQACARRSSTERLKEVWEALGDEEKRVLSEAHLLPEDAQDEFFLNIVEQDRLQRRKLSNMEVVPPQMVQQEDFLQCRPGGVEAQSQQFQAQATLRCSDVEVSPSISVRSRICALERASSASSLHSHSGFAAGSACCPSGAATKGLVHSRSAGYISQRHTLPMPRSRPGMSQGGVPPPVSWNPRSRQHAIAPPTPQSESRRSTVESGTVRDRIRTFNSNGLQVEN
jgi:hypothetical protein